MFKLSHHVTKDTLTEQHLRRLMAGAIVHEDHGLERYCQIALGYTPATPNATIDDALTVCTREWNDQRFVVVAVPKMSSETHDRSALTASAWINHSAASGPYAAAQVTVADEAICAFDVTDDKHAALAILERLLVEAISDVHNEMRVVREDDERNARLTASSKASAPHGRLTGRR